MGRYVLPYPAIKDIFSELVSELNSGSSIRSDVTAYTQQLTGEKHDFVSPVHFFLKIIFYNIVMFIMFKLTIFLICYFFISFIICKSPLNQIFSITLLKMFHLLRKSCFHIRIENIMKNYFPSRFITYHNFDEIF